MNFGASNGLMQALNSFHVSPCAPQVFGNAGSNVGWTNSFGWVPSKSVKEEYNGGWGDCDDDSDMSDDSGNWGCEKQSTLLEDYTVKNEFWSTPQQSAWPSAAPLVTKTEGWAGSQDGFFNRGWGKENGQEAKETKGKSSPFQSGLGWKTRDESKEKTDMIQKYFQLRCETEKIEMALKSYGVSKVDLMNMEGQYRSW